jgi:tetratricopeptide (TPR) repeat protein
MSLFDAIKKKNALKTALNQVAQARELAADKADPLYEKAYQGFEAAIAKELTISQALYHWGFALLHQAKSKTGEQAVGLYQEAITKFSFCLLIDPDYLGAAIDGGVALMDLARLKQANADDPLYESAKRSFEKANKIQQGSASYNLACVYSLCDEQDACLAALKEAKQHGSLPNADEIVQDPDMRSVAQTPWFVEFIASLQVIETTHSAETPPALGSDEVSSNT